MEELQHEHTSGKWDLKAVLLYNGNNFPFIPLAHAVHRKKHTRTSRFCCKKICYEEHWWNICADLKVIAMPTVLQVGYTKFCCF